MVTYMTKLGNRIDLDIWRIFFRWYHFSPAFGVYLAGPGIGVPGLILVLASLIPPVVWFGTVGYSDKKGLYSNTLLEPIRLT